MTTKRASGKAGRAGRAGKGGAGRPAKKNGGAGGAGLPRWTQGARSVKYAERTQTYALAGGSRLQLLPLPGTGTVVMHGNLRAGAALDSAEQPGLAELTARGLDLGTAHHARLKIAEDLDGRGVSFRFSGGTLTAAFSARCLHDDFEMCAGYMIEMLREPAFPDDEIAKLKQRAAAQIRESADSTSAMAFETFHRALYPERHPLWVAPMEERLQALDRLTAADARRFHREAYGPADLLLTVVGDVEGGAVRSMFERLLAGWTGPARRTEPWDDVGREGATPRLSVAMPGKATIDVVWGHRTALRRNDVDYLPAMLGNLALGGSTLSSRLGVRVRDTEGLTYGIFSRFTGASLSPGPWAVSVTVAPENMAKALSSTRDVVDKFLTKGIDARELEGEQEHTAGAYKVGLATNDGIARQLHDAAFYGFGPGYLDSFPELVRAVTRSDVNEAVRRHIKPADALTIAAGPGLPGREAAG